MNILMTLLTIVMNATLLYQTTDQTGEGAMWWPEHNRFVWVDIDHGTLHLYDLATRRVSDVALPEVITSVVPWKGHPDELILTMKNRLVAYHVGRKSFRTLCELPLLRPMWRTNDCKVAADGRHLWLGVMHMKEHNGNAALMMLDADGHLRTVLTGQSIPNGLVWSEDGRRMYYVDSGRKVIEEYAYNGESGRIDYLRTVVHVPDGCGVPDGMTLDRDGNLWVAHWGGFGVYVWNIATGRLVKKVTVPVPNVASCTFVGGDRLFITTARDGLTPAELEQYPQSGSLFVADVKDAHPGQNHYAFSFNEAVKNEVFEH